MTNKGLLLRYPKRYVSQNYMDISEVPHYYCPDCICSDLSASREVKKHYGSMLGLLKCKSCEKSWDIYSLLSLTREEARDRRISKIVNI